MEYVIIPLTSDPTFNYFFSMPIWFFIVLVPILLAFSVFKKM